MKKNLLLAAAVLFSAPAFAEWKFYGNNGEATYYFYPDSIRNSGKTRMVWTAENFKNYKDGYMSGKFLFEIDCREGSYRILQKMFYKASGFIGPADISVHKKDSFYYIPPDSILRKLSKMVCSR